MFSRRNKLKISWLLLTLATVIILWLAAILSLYYLIDHSKWPQSGVFGDSFGVLNTLFSGLAFGVIIFTIFQQQNQIEAQQTQFQTEWFEKMLLSQLDAHENLKTQLNTSQAFDDAIQKLMSTINRYSEQLNIKSFETYRFTYLNPKQAFEFDRILFDEYIDSFLSLIDLVDREASKESRNFYMDSLLYPKLDLNERYLIGFYLEMQLNKRLIEKSANYENKLKQYYLKSHNHLKEEYELPPRFTVEFHPYKDHQKKSEITIKDVNYKLSVSPFPDLKIKPNGDISDFEILNADLELKPFQANTTTMLDKNLLGNQIILKQGGTIIQASKAFKTFFQIGIIPSNEVYNNIINERSNELLICLKLKHSGQASSFYFNLPISFDIDRYSDGEYRITLIFKDY